MKGKILIAILIAMIFLGIGVRSIELINHNYLWGFDHGREYLMTKDIVVNKNPILIGTPLGAGSAGFQGIFHGPGYYYFLAIPFILFSGDPYGGVVLMWAFGLGSLIVGYLLGSKLFGLKGGLLVTALISISPPLTSQSRSIWSPHPTTFFILLSFYFTYLWISSKKRKRNVFLFLAAFFAGFIYNFELAIAVPITLSLIILSIIILKKNLIGYVYAFAGFAIAYLPMLLFEVRHNFMAINGILKYLSTPSHDNKMSYIGNIIDHFFSFLYNFASTLPPQNVIPAILLLIALIVIFGFVVRSEKGVEKRVFLLWLASFPFFTFFILSFLRNAVYGYYLYHVTIVYILIFSYLILHFISNKKMEWKKLLAASFLILSFIIAVPYYAKIFAYDIKDYGGDAKIKGKTEAIDYIYKDAKGKDFGLFIFTPPVYTYPYDYLIDWYAKKKYGYVPLKEKKGTFYLLMEVDSTKPWSYKGWQETVIKDGEVIFDIALPSGILIQKRIAR